MSRESSEIQAARSDAGFVREIVAQQEAEVAQHHEMSRRSASLPEGHEGK
jgi:hypothetical protein